MSRHVTAEGRLKPELALVALTMWMPLKHSWSGHCLLLFWGGTWSKHSSTVTVISKRSSSIASRPGLASDSIVKDRKYIKRQGLLSFRHK